MIIILKTKWLSSLRMVAPKLDNNHICTEAVFKGILPCLYGMGRECHGEGVLSPNSRLLSCEKEVKKKRGIIPCQTMNINKNAA